MIGMKLARFRRHQARFASAVLIAIISVGATQARTISIKINLKGTCGTVKAANGITVILNGDEDNPFYPKAQDLHTWTGGWQDSRTPAFPDSRICASVRLGGARTYCRWSEKPTKDADDVPLATFSFDCDENAVQHATIDPKPEVFVGYVRRLNSLQTSDLDCDCEEKTSFPGFRTILDLRFPTEKLLLQFGRKHANPDAAGLLLFSETLEVPALLSPDPKKPGQLTIGAALDKKYAKTDGILLTITRDGIVHALFVQRSAENGDFSVVGIDIDRKVLEKLKVVDIALKKADR